MSSRQSLIFLVAVTILASSRAADLSMYALGYYVDADASDSQATPPHSDYIRSVRCELYLRNESSGKIVVPTKVSGTLVNPENGSLKSGRMTLRFVVGFKKGRRGELLVPSSGDLSIVDLQPGESTRIWVDATVPRQVRLDGSPVSFEVEEALAKRFRCWTGVVRTALETDSSMISPPSSDPARRKAIADEIAARRAQREKALSELPPPVKP